MQLTRFEEGNAYFVFREADSRSTDLPPQCNSVALPTEQVSTCGEEGFSTGAEESRVAPLHCTTAESEELSTGTEESRVAAQHCTPAEGEEGFTSGAEESRVTAQHCTPEGKVGKSSRELFNSQSKPNGEVLTGKGAEDSTQPLKEEAVSENDTTAGSDGIRPPSGSKARPPAPLGLKTAPPVPASSQCEEAETDSDVAERKGKKPPTEVMSPRSYSFFKTSLVHVPEMNLPWESMRNTSKCGCGVTFSYSIRKVHASVCVMSYKPISI